MNEVSQRTFFHRSGIRSSPHFWASLLLEAAGAAPELSSIALSDRGGRRQRVKQVLNEINKGALMRLAAGTANSNAKQLDSSHAHAFETVEKIRSSVLESLLEGVESLSAVKNVTIKETAFEPNRRAFWEQLFQQPDPWNYTSPYEQLKCNYSHPYKNSLLKQHYMIDFRHTNTPLSNETERSRFTTN